MFSETLQVALQSLPFAFILFVNLSNYLLFLLLLVLYRDHMETQERLAYLQEGR